MTKKQWIISAGAIAGVTAFAIGVAVPIAVIEHNKTWKVKIANANGSRYVLTQLDPTSNKASLTDIKKATWDLVDSADHKRILADYLGKIPENQVQLGIRDNLTYSNGIEKLFYDLTKNFIANTSDLTISFKNAAEYKTTRDNKEIVLDAIIFDKAFTKNDEATRISILETMINTPITEDDNDDDLFVRLLTSINIYDDKNDSDLSNDEIRTTTVADLTTALAKVTS